MFERRNVRLQQQELDSKEMRYVQDHSMQI
jgi:hypothetical protein